MSLLVTHPMYDIENKRYIDLNNERFKIPWRCGKVQQGVCTSVTPIQSFQKGDTVQVTYVINHGVKVITSICIINGP